MRSEGEVMRCWKGAGKGKNGAREGKEKEENSGKLKTEGNRTLIWLWFHSFGTELTELGEGC